MNFLSIDNQQKICGFCGESIPAGAGRCPYCGSILEVEINNDYNISRDNSSADNTNASNNGNEQINYDQGTDIQDQNTSGSDAENGGQQAYNEAGGRQPQQPVYKSSVQNSNNQYVPYSQSNSNYEKRKQLSNGIKVLLTAIAVAIPGLGQLAGIIAAIIFMNAEGDSDRKSFGVALLVASLIIFVFACIGCFVLSMIGSSFQGDLSRFMY